MYDITNRSSFDHVTDWVKSARQVGTLPLWCNVLHHKVLSWLQHGAVDLQIILVGHKCDKEEHRTVEQREGRAVRPMYTVLLFELEIVN